MDKATIRRGRGWDLGLDYEAFNKKLVRFMRVAREHFPSLTWQRRYVYCVVLLTQLRNGSRISEAIEAVKAWAETGRREVWVKLGKSKDRKRLMIIPNEVSDRVRGLVKLHIKEINRNNVYAFARRRWGINTHSLRYALVTYLGKQGYPAQIIAKITGHSSLQYIQHYTEKTAAFDILRRLAGPS